MNYISAGQEKEWREQELETRKLLNKKAQKSEARIQQDCVMWFKNEFPYLAILLFHIANGEKRDPATAMKLKGMGVTKGVPDLFLSVSNPEYHGLYIEMKNDKGKPSKEQLEFQSKSIYQGYAFFICRSLDEFKELILRYMKIYIKVDYRVKNDN